MRPWIGVWRLMLSALVGFMRNDSALECMCDEYVTISHKIGHYEMCDVKMCEKYYCLECLKFSGSDCGLEYDDI